MNKYRILKDQCKIVNGSHVFRIQALQSFGNVLSGEIGGWVSSYDNLSQFGDCWIKDDAVVYENAKVLGNSLVSGSAKVYGDARIYDNAKVYEYACIFGNARIYDNAKVYGFANVCGNSQIYSNAKVSGDTIVLDRAEVCGNAETYGSVWIYGNSTVCMDAKVYGNLHIAQDALITSIYDYKVIYDLEINQSKTSIFKCKDGNIKVISGKFSGTLEDFIKHIKYSNGKDIENDLRTMVRHVEPTFKVHIDTDNECISKIS